MHSGGTTLSTYCVLGLMLWKVTATRKAAPLEWGRQEVRKPVNVKQLSPNPIGRDRRGGPGGWGWLSLFPLLFHQPCKRGCPVGPVQPILSDAWVLNSDMELKKRNFWTYPLGC